MDKPRSQIVRSLQMELFQIEVAISEYEAKRKEIKARLAAHGAGKKTCTKCGEEMDIEQFYVDRQKLDGRCSWCQECCRSHRLRAYHARKVA